VANRTFLGLEIGLAPAAMLRITKPALRASNAKLRRALRWPQFQMCLAALGHSALLLSDLPLVVVVLVGAPSRMSLALEIGNALTVLPKIIKPGLLAINAASCNAKAIGSAIIAAHQISGPAPHAPDVDVCNALEIGSARVAMK